MNFPYFPLKLFDFQQISVTFKNNLRTVLGLTLIFSEPSSEIWKSLHLEKKSALKYGEECDLNSFQGITAMLGAKVQDWSATKMAIMTPWKVWYLLLWQTNKSWRRRGELRCSFRHRLLTQPANIDSNKKWLPKQKTIQNFNIDAPGLRKTRNENPPTWKKGVTS